MTTRLSLWFDGGPKRDRKVFQSVAELGGADQNIVVPVRTGTELFDLVMCQEKRSIDHVLIAAHGGPTWLLNPRFGAVVRGQRKGQVEVWELAKALEQISKGRLLVSLASCLCSRSPDWYLRLTDRIGSNWGPRGYKRGGRKSFSGQLRDYLRYYGCDARVRGHRASGHSSHCAILAEHNGIPGSKCETLFERALPGVNPTLKVRRWWIKHVTGELAEGWLLGDDSIEKIIFDLYYRR